MIGVTREKNILFQKTFTVFTKAFPDTTMFLRCVFLVLGKILIEKNESLKVTRDSPH